MRLACYLLLPRLNAAPGGSGDAKTAPRAALLEARREPVRSEAGQSAPAPVALVDAVTAAATAAASAQQGGMNLLRTPCVYAPAGSICGVRQTQLPRRSVAIAPGRRRRRAPAG